MSKDETELGPIGKVIGTGILIAIIVALIFGAMSVSDYYTLNQRMGGDTILNCENRVRNYPELAPLFIEQLEDGKFSQGEYNIFMVEYSKAAAKDAHDREVNYEEGRKRHNR